jgi:hypothetical protein
MLTKKQVDYIEYVNLEGMLRHNMGFQHRIVIDAKAPKGVSEWKYCKSILTDFSEN